MNQCKLCGSWAINHGRHGRDGTDVDLCDVCYWRKRADGFGDNLKKNNQKPPLPNI
jgi:hypothetical protein